VALDSIDVESLMMDGDDDKVYGAMGVAKTIETVCVLSPSRSFNASHKAVQVVSCMEAGASPKGLRNGWPGIVGGTLNIFKVLPQAIASGLRIVGMTRHLTDGVIL
jgi:hypothetical protein